MKIAIYGQNYNNKSVEEAFKVLLNVLLKHNTTIFVEKAFYTLHTAITSQHKILIPFNKLDHSFDLLISIGGDGTILRAVTFVQDFNIPIVGINTGRLGFLATIQSSAIEKAFLQICDGNYTISKRSLLSVQTNPEHPSLSTINLALNEVAVSRKNTTSMITVKTHLNNEYLTSYWADGLIVATPTGSTGYSLSCGGPVISPRASNFVLTPIAPHNLNARPLVIPDNTTIQLQVDGREDQFLLSLDSRIITLPNTANVTIKKANFCINMVELLNENFIDTLRKKMLWGEDRRN